MEIDSINEFVLALKNIAIEYKGHTSKFVVNEINNQIDNWNMSDRESSSEQQSGVRDNCFFMKDILNEFSKRN